MLLGKYGYSRLFAKRCREASSSLAEHNITRGRADGSSPGSLPGTRRFESGPRNQRAKSPFLKNMAKVGCVQGLKARKPLRAGRNVRFVLSTSHIGEAHPSVKIGRNRNTIQSVKPDSLCTGVSISKGERARGEKIPQLKRPSEKSTANVGH